MSDADLNANSNAKPDVETAVAPAVSEPAGTAPAVDPAVGSSTSATLPATFPAKPTTAAPSAEQKELAHERDRGAVPAAPPPTAVPGAGSDGRPLVKAATSGGTVVAADLDSGKDGPVESAVNEFMDQVGNPQHPLGPFQDPQSTMIAGIEEHVGYVPGWLLMLCIIAVLLAMIMWYPSSY